MKHSRSRAGIHRARIRTSAGWAGVSARGLAFLLLVIVCTAGIRWIFGGAKSSMEHWKQPAPSGTESLSALAGPHPEKVQPHNRRLVYPYSVIPGGVRSGAELREIAAHDAAVARHYTGFNYNRAHVIEVNEPRLVYLSYRRGDKVYWTRKQASLRKGEMLLTDGNMTARTRCGNQVSILPQSNTSPEEPLIAELDRPDAVASGIEALPSNMDSLLHVDPGMPLGPSSPAGGGTFPGGGPPSGFVPLPVGGPGGGGSTPPPATGGGGGCTPNCNSPQPPVPPPATVPEPGTVVLVLSGAAAVFARFRTQR